MFKGKLLRNFTILILLISLAFPLSVYAAAPGNEAQQSQDQPTIDVLNSTSDYIDVIVRFPATPIYQSNSETVFDLNMYNRPADEGVPDLPVLRKDIELPLGSDYSIEILESTYSTGTLGENGLPVVIPNRPAETEKCDPLDEDCEILNEDETTDPIEEDQLPSDTDEIIPPEETDEIVPPEETDEIIPPEETTTTQSDDLFPATPAQLINTYIVRGHQVGQFQFWPVQYSPANQTVVIYQALTLRITWNQVESRSTVTNSAAYSSYVFENLLADHIVNYSQEIQIETTRDKANDAVLIIAPDAFLSTLSSLVSLKESQGHPVSLVGLSTTGTTPESIKSYVYNAYHYSTQPPTYLLLIGDVNNGSNTMPAFTGLSSGTVTDLYYGTVDGSDWIPDIFVGRLPARNTTQLNTMINNLVAYNNLTGAEEWVKKAALLASNDSNYWQIAEATQNYVINNRTLPAGYTGTFPSSAQAGGDKLYAQSYSAGNSNVINAINNRRSLISYTGHGSRTSWGGPGFYQSNIRNISHTGTFSVVTSFACLTGDFNATESFGETWMLQPNKGAVAFIGASSSSYWGPDDTLERAMMDSLYSGANSANIVSSFRFAGLMAVEATRPGTGVAQSRYYWEIYNLLGDPALAMLIKPNNTNPDYYPQLSTSAISVGQTPGKDAVIRLELTNSGLKADSYELDSSTNGWTASMQSKQTITMEPGETVTLEILISIPADAEYGQKQDFILLVTSIDDLESPAAKDSTTIELMAAILIFIPIVNNW